MASPPSSIRPPSKISENAAGSPPPRVLIYRIAYAPTLVRTELFHADARDLADHDRQLLDARHRRVDVLFDGEMREHDDVDLLFAGRGLLLHHRVDRNAAVSEHARDVGEHPRLIVHAKP